MTIKSRKVLILLLDEKLDLLISATCPQQSFIFNGISYFDRGWGDFVGFFDWLRTDLDEIVGVQINPWAEFDFPYEGIGKLSYVSIDSHSLIRIRFSMESEIDESKSGDQGFLDNRFYRSKENRFAISFRMPDHANQIECEVARRIRLLEPA